MTLVGIGEECPGVAMPSFRDLPIRRKVLLISMAITVAAPPLDGAGIPVLDSIQFRRHVSDDVATRAEIIANDGPCNRSFTGGQMA